VEAIVDGDRCLVAVFAHAHRRAIDDLAVIEDRDRQRRQLVPGTNDLEGFLRVGGKRRRAARRDHQHE
jgi:hypothetical protein